MRHLRRIVVGLRDVLLSGDTRFSEVNTGLILLMVGLAGLQPPAPKVPPDSLGIAIYLGIATIGVVRIVAGALGGRAMRTASGIAATFVFAWGALLGFSHLTWALLVYVVWVGVIALSAYRIGRQE